MVVLALGRSDWYRTPANYRHDRYSYGTHVPLSVTSFTRAWMGEGA
jgi:hypothetical protein